MRRIQSSVPGVLLVALGASLLSACDKRDPPVADEDFCYESEIGWLDVESVKSIPVRGHAAEHGHIAELFDEDTKFGLDDTAHFKVEQKKESSHAWSKVGKVQCASSYVYIDEDRIAKLYVGAARAKLHGNSRSEKRDHFVWFFHLDVPPPISVDVRDRMRYFCGGITSRAPHKELKLMLAERSSTKRLVDILDTESKDNSVDICLAYENAPRPKQESGDVAPNAPDSHNGRIHGRGG
ncbi:MAG: hypothetical protein AAGH76_02855 [Pseudomonadota bacterium]